MSTQTAPGGTLGPHHTFSCTTSHHVPPTSPPQVGPWGACNSTAGSYGCDMCMGGNYAATTSYVSSVLSAVQEEVAAAGGTALSHATNASASVVKPPGLSGSALIARSSAVARVCRSICS